jgi:hypothetical protein
MPQQPARRPPTHRAFTLVTRYQQTTYRFFSLSTVTISPYSPSTYTISVPFINALTKSPYAVNLLSSHAIWASPQSTLHFYTRSTCVLAVAASQSLISRAHPILASECNFTSWPTTLNCFLDTRDPHRHSGSTSSRKPFSTIVSKVSPRYLVPSSSRIGAFTRPSWYTRTPASGSPRHQGIQLTC